MSNEDAHVDVMCDAGHRRIRVERFIRTAAPYTDEPHWGYESAQPGNRTAALAAADSSLAPEFDSERWRVIIRCPLCGLDLRRRHDKFIGILDRLAAHGVSEVHLAHLVAIVTT